MRSSSALLGAFPASSSAIPLEVSDQPEATHVSATPGSVGGAGAYRTRWLTRLFHSRAG